MQSGPHSNRVVTSLTNEAPSQPHSGNYVNPGGDVTHWASSTVTTANRGHYYMQGHFCHIQILCVICTKWMQVREPMSVHLSIYFGFPKLLDGVFDCCNTGRSVQYMVPAKFKLACIGSPLLHKLQGVFIRQNAFRIIYSLRDINHKPQ
jgi:hypothetical protein